MDGHLTIMWRLPETVRVAGAVWPGCAAQQVHPRCRPSRQLPRRAPGRAGDPQEEVVHPYVRRTVEDGDQVVKDRFAEEKSANETLTALDDMDTGQSSETTQQNTVPGAMSEAGRSLRGT